MNETFIDTNGITLHALDFPGDGPTLVLMHGLTTNAHSFRGLAEAGLAPVLHVVALDLRGRGLSDKPDTGYTMRDHTADLIGVLDRLGVERAIVGGHSFGGLVTYHAAAAHPDRIERCVVMDAPAVVERSILDQIQPALDRLGAVVPSWEEYLARMRAMPFYDGWWDPMIEEFFRADVEVEADGSVRARSHPEHIRQCVEGSLDVDWPATVARIEQPTLLLRAVEPYGPPGSPPILPEDKARRTMELLPDGRLHEFPGNHMTFLFGDVAPMVAGTIIDFVTGA